MEEYKNIVDKAQVVLPKADFIVDLFNMAVVWVSEAVIKRTGYSFDELVQMKGLDMSIIADERDKRLITAKHFEMQKGTEILRMRMKNGEIVDFHYEFKIMEFGGNSYTVGKMSEVVPVKE